MRWKIWRCEKCRHEVTEGYLERSMDDEIYIDAAGIFCASPTGGGGSWCLGVMVPHYHTSGQCFGINNAPYPKPLHSDALGIQPDQVAEHRELFPGTELDSENRPVFTNANQHDAYMEKAGIRKDVQKTRRPGEVIAKLESEDAVRTDEAKISEEDSEETKDAGRVHEDGLDGVALAGVQ